MMESGTLTSTSNILISIVIPVFNRAFTLPRLFASLSRINYSPLEIIIVDNGSTDGSMQLIEKYCNSAQNSNVTVVATSELRKGACACRNKGASMSHGEFLYFFDSDDEISEDFLYDMSQYFDHYDVVCAPTLMVFENGYEKVRDCIATDKVYDHILSSSISTQSFVIRKTFFDYIGGWDEQLLRWNDWELGVRILCHSPRLFWSTTKPYHRIYQHKRSISGKTYSEDILQIVSTLEKVDKDIRTSSLQEKVKKRSVRALKCRYLLASSKLYSEGDVSGMRLLENKADQIMGGLVFSWICRILLLFSKHHIPGIWRLYLMLCR